MLLIISKRGHNMQNITVNLRLRPIRFAFIVRPNDEKNILEIFQINACLWGG